MFTITPPPRSTIRRAIACATRNMPRRFTFNTRSQSPAAMSRKRSFRAIPALLISTSTPPRTVSASSTRAVTSRSRLTSQARPVTVPMTESSEATASTSEASSPQKKTRLPSSRNRATVALPIPLLPPVTRTPFSLRPRIAEPPGTGRRACAPPIPCPHARDGYRRDVVQQGADSGLRIVRRAEVQPASAVHGLFVTFGLVFAAFFPFFAIYLRARGLRPDEIGLVIAVMALARIVANPIFGHFADTRIGRLAALQIGVVGAALAAVAMNLVDAPGAIAAAAFFVAGFNSTAPNVDAIALVYLGDERMSNYG